MAEDTEAADAKEPPFFDPKPDRPFKGKQIFPDDGLITKFWRSIFPGPENRREEVRVDMVAGMAGG